MATRLITDEIEKATCRRMKTPRDFEWLSEKIFERTHERLSATTLKRLFGYLGENVRPRSFTLDILSRFLGYKDYDAFCAQPDSAEPPSNLIMQDTLSPDGIPCGQLLRLTWLPDRVCCIRHLGGGRFRVENAVNTKLEAGDTFSCNLFIKHEPLYLDNLIHGGAGPTAYVAGKQDGITFELVGDNE